MTEATDTTTTTDQSTSSSEMKASTEAQSTQQQTTDQSTTKGSGTDADGKTTTTTTANDTPWQDSLPDDLKTNPLFRTYKDVGELAKAHDHLTKLKGATAAELLKIPAKPQDQDPEAWAPIHKALGVPDDPKDYKIELAPEAAADAPALVETLRELGGEAKLQPAQMAAVVKKLNELGAKAVEQEAADLDAETKTTTETLAKKWGAATEGNKRGIGKLIRDAIDADVAGIKDPAEREAAVAEAMADLETKLGSNVTLSIVLAHALGKMAEPENPEGEAQRAAAAKQLTPAAATAALNAFYADPEKMKALNDGKHPQHKAVLAERGGLLTQQRGEKRPDQAG